MSAWDWIAAIFFTSGCFFFLAGAVGLVRFPDVLTRLHALTKADNVGLGMIALGSMLLADSWAVVLKIALVWIIVLISSATTSYLIADYARGTPGGGRE